MQNADQVKTDDQQVRSTLREYLLKGMLNYLKKNPLTLMGKTVPAVEYPADYEWQPLTDGHEVYQFVQGQSNYPGEYDEMTDLMSLLRDDLIRVDLPGYPGINWLDTADDFVDQHPQMVLLAFQKLSKDQLGDFYTSFSDEVLEDYGNEAGIDPDPVTRAKWLLEKLDGQVDQEARDSYENEMEYTIALLFKKYYMFELSFPDIVSQTVEMTIQDQWTKHYQKDFQQAQHDALPAGFQSIMVQTKQVKNKKQRERAQLLVWLSTINQLTPYLNSATNRITQSNVRWKYLIEEGYMADEVYDFKKRVLSNLKDEPGVTILHESTNDGNLSFYWYHIEIGQLVFNFRLPMFTGLQWLQSTEHYAPIQQPLHEGPKFGQLNDDDAFLVAANWNIIEQMRKLVPTAFPHGFKPTGTNRFYFD
ncbi:hypothetical protein FOD75_10905 (plasmid) [Limosilactobacillus reuteri]|uniref:Uncharacterized protein n=1 Tax=Limosilactobacillus reuteri TaxID=1598 RepID=A0A517D8B9_LIMRT|nr:hypothetical protein [Limosilactobacillus reuteri]QDR73598.1 hypothetical protein FOD75_10905 [Limosilactobacillus reuteri]